MHSEDLVGIGFVYYAAMLNGTRVQGPFGSTASVDVTGTNISNGIEKQWQTGIGETFCVTFPLMQLVTHCSQY